MDIQVDELKDKLDAKESFRLVDVREPHEHEEFNVGGDLIPLAQFIQQIPDFESEKEHEIVLYCRSGQRSGMAKRFMEQQGFKNVRNLEGGMLDWIRKFGPGKP